MRRHFSVIFILLFYSTQYAIGQEINTDCYTANEIALKKVSFSRFSDIRLKNILKPFFMLSDTDYSQLYFIDYKPKLINDSVAYFKIDDGLAKGYEVRLESKKFDPNNHKFTKSTDGEICLIDNKVFWGTDGDMPTDKVSKLDVKLNKQAIFVPLSEFNDLYNPSFLYGPDVVHVEAKMDKKGEYFIIVLFGSDGAGSYSSVWIFENGKYFGRAVESL